MKLTRSISSLGLLFISISAIMGSGWLFSSFYSSELAGPAATLSWIIGGIFMIIVAFTFAEAFSMIPVSGSSVRIPQISHGKVVGVFCSITIWFTYIVVMIIEVQAVCQYLCFYFPEIMGASGLSWTGYSIAVVLLFVLSIANIVSMKWISRSNTILTFLKIIIPIFIGIMLILLLYTIGSVIHPVHSLFAPYGIHGILAGISTGGIVFSYNGFKYACEVGGESKNPGFSIPFAVIGSIVICMIIFVILQSSFLSSITPADIKNGWASLTLINNNSPFASLMLEHHLTWMIPILYIAAIISPLAAGLIYCTCASRSLYGIAMNGYAPKVLLKMNKASIPFFTVWVNFFIALIIFNFFSGWHQIADLLTYLFAIAFIFGPICMITFRKQIPDLKRYVKLPFGRVWGYIALYLCSLFIYWVGWEIISESLYFIIFCIVVAFIIQKITKVKFKDAIDDWKCSLWLWLYVFVLYFCSYAGNYGGHNILNTLDIQIVFLVANLIVVILAVKFCKTTKEALQELQNI